MCLLITHDRSFFIEYQLSSGSPFSLPGMGTTMLGFLKNNYFEIHVYLIKRVLL